MRKVLKCLRGWRMTFECYTSNLCCVILWSHRLWFRMKLRRIIVKTSCHDCSYLHFQFSHSVVSNSLWPHGLQHARPPCPSPTPRIYSNSYPLSWWGHPTISSSAVPFSSHLQSFPASGSFPVSQFLASGGQSTGASASAISPSNDYSGLISFRMDWLDLLAIQGTLMSLLQHHSLIPIK